MTNPSLLLYVGVLSLVAPFAVLAEGVGPGGQDVLHVPISWCAVQGSPAENSPNITGLNGTTDTSTDAVLWRRHERPTDNIVLGQSGISFRSAINNAWGTLNFPIIPDPDTSFGTPGDIRGEDLNVSDVEFNDIINSCEAAWANLGRAGIGITAVNINMFVTAAGDYLTNATPGMISATPIGWGGCTTSGATGECVDPLDARIAVADNNYLYPTVIDRSWRPSPLDPAPTFQYGSTDPLDQLVGHELGHALGLPHASGSTNLMFGTSTDNDADGNVDNINISSAESTLARNNALATAGLEIDPPNQFDPGRYVRTRLPDAEGKRDAELEGEAQAHLELSAVSGILDTVTNTAFIDVQLGVMTNRAFDEPFEAWIALDLPEIQAEQNTDALAKLGFPAPDLLDGADMFLQVIVRNGEISGQGVTIRDNELVTLDKIQFDLNTLVMHPYYAQGLEGPDIEARIFDIIRVTLPPELNVLELDKEIGLKAFVVAQDRIIDQLDTPHAFILEIPSFPHCFPAELQVRPGATTAIRFEKLQPNQGVHGLLGPNVIARGVADENGNGTLQYNIPADTEEGFHLVTIGTDDTALTADCTLQVTKDADPIVDTSIDDQTFSLIKSHERLLHDQQDLLEIFGELLAELFTADAITADEQVNLAEGYRTLLDRQTSLIERFETIVERAMQR